MIITLSLKFSSLALFQNITTEAAGEAGAIDRKEGPSIIMNLLEVDVKGVKCRSGS